MLRIAGLKVTPDFECLATKKHGMCLNEMIGHSQLRGISQTEVTPTDRQTKINFMSISGGTTKNIVDVFKHRIEAAKVSTKYSLLLFQNDVRTFGKDGSPIHDMKRILRECFHEIDQAVYHANESTGLKHKVAIAEELFVPELFEYHEQIDILNQKIRSQNLKNGISPFKLWKPLMKPEKSNLNKMGP